MSDDPEIEEEEEKGPGWIVSFADLMTLLFATFVVLYGLKPEGQSDQIVGVTSSIRESFVEIPDRIPEDQKKGPIHQGKAVFRHFKGDRSNQPILKVYRRSEYYLNIIDKDLNQLKDLIVDEFGKEASKGKERTISVHKEEDGIRMRVLSSLLYDAGEYRVGQDKIPKLRQLGNMLKGMGQKIHIEGHTDEVPPNGPFNNWEIASLRASFVGKYFVSELGFAPEKISYAGYADTRPVASNKTPAGRKMNRRVEIKIQYVE